MSDIRVSYYAWLVAVVHVHLQMMNTILLYFLIFDNPYDQKILQQPNLESIIDDLINKKLEELWKIDQKDIFAKSLQYLFIVGIWEEHISSIVSGGMLMLFSNVRSIFESSILSLFDIVFPQKIEDKKNESIKNICKYLEVDFGSLDQSTINQLLQEVKVYPFTNKLGSLVWISPAFKKKYSTEYDSLVKDIYLIRNSQHNRWVNLDWSVKKIVNLTTEIERLGEFLSIFQGIVDSCWLDINQPIKDPLSEIIQKHK